MAIARLLRQKIALHVEDVLAATVRIRRMRSPSQRQAAQEATVRTLAVGALVFDLLAVGGHDGHAQVPQCFTRLLKCKH